MNDALLDRIVLLSMVEAPARRSRAWTPEEDQYLRDHLAEMTDAEIGERLGRSEMAVHLRWSRDLGLPSRSKHPDVLTARRAAELLGIDMHKIEHWVDVGLIPGRLMPGKRTPNHMIRLIDRTAFRRWVLNPANWPYFNPKKVRDPELKHMLKLRAARWGDEWWTARQVADHHRVDIRAVNQQIRRGAIPSFQPPVSLCGRHPERAWACHFIKKSDALRAPFLKGKGAARTLPKFTPAADAWILKARDELGMTFVAIGRTMKCGGEKIGIRGTRSNAKVGNRYHQLKKAQARKSRKGSKH